MPLRLLVFLALPLACAGVSEGAGSAPVAAPAVPSARPPADALVLPRPPRNVLMVSVDTLRRDHVSRYGGGSTTPFLDSLLASGLALDDHRSCSNWTLPAVLCALSGRDPVTMGWFPEGTLGVSGPLPAGTRLVAGMLAEAGFATALVSANPLFGPKSGFGADYGQAQTGMFDADVVVSRGQELLATLRASGKPWFLHLHLIDPHSPYRPKEGWAPPPVAGVNPALPMQGIENQWPKMDPATRAATLASVKGLYAAEVRYTDDALRRLFAELDARGDLDDTLVVLWSDHGEQFQDHGAWQHGVDLHDEETAALGGFWMKGMTPVAWTGPTTHADLVPTLLDALGLPAPVPMTGVVVGWRAADAPRFAEVLKGQYTLQSVDSAGWRLTYGWDGSMRLWHHAEDPAGTRDLYTPDHPEAKRLWALLEPQVARLAALETRVKPVPPGAPRPADMGPDPWSGGGDPATQANAAGRAGGAGMGPPADRPGFAPFEGSRSWQRGTWRGATVWVAVAADRSNWVAIRVDEAPGASFWLVRREMVAVDPAGASKVLPAGSGQRGFPQVPGTQTGPPGGGPGRGGR